ncbi:MAG TPA: hypothetical protein VNL74_08935 [Methylococcus sp.]|nr:hypothetical protein [Methylococcus sp.]
MRHPRRAAAGRHCPRSGFLPHLLSVLILARIPVELRYETTIQGDNTTRDESARRTIVDSLNPAATQRQVA